MDPTFTLGFTGYPVETRDSFITVGQCYSSVKTTDLEPTRWQKERNADIRSKPISLPIYHPGCHHLYNIRPGKCYFGSKENRQWRVGGTALFVASELQAAIGYSAVFFVYFPFNLLSSISNIYRPSFNLSIFLLHRLASLALLAPCESIYVCSLFSRRKFMQR